MTECSVCEKHETKKTLPGGAVYDGVRVFVGHFPLIESEKAHYGHVILELKRHITKLAELTEAEAVEIGQWTRTIARFLETELGAEHVYAVRIGDKTPHLHFHFVPRFPGTPKEVWSPTLWQWPGGRKATADDMIAITKKFVAFLS